MKRLLFVTAAAALLALSSGLPQGQYVNTQYVKGGHHDSNDFQSRLNAASQRLKNNTNVAYVDPDTGVCYQEVLTASLVKDQSHIPPSNGSKPGYSSIRVCCPGYQRNPHNFRRCDPRCEQECVNAECTAPNTCTCFPEHVTNLAGYCVATCPIGCQNGVCDGDQCRCKPGYKLNQRRAFCEPLCNNDCGGHGNCTAPDECVCESGYTLSANGKCEHQCQNCRHGECLPNGECLCFKGYAKDHRGVCEPVCSQGCSGGVCSAPDTCSCSYGYKLENNICVPHCSQPCLNGLCAGPNVCTCNRGYVKDPSDPTESTCIGHCPGGCPNGSCSGPNLCICNVGFIKDRSVKGSQVCIRRTRRSVEDGDHHMKFMIPEFDD